MGYFTQLHTSEMKLFFIPSKTQKIIHSSIHVILDYFLSPGNILSSLT